MSTEWVSGNIFIRPMRGNKGQVLCGAHKHNFDHTTIIFKGSVHVTATLPDGRVVEVDKTAPAYLLIRKNVKHQFTATTDDTEVWCTYSHRTPQGEISQEYTGWGAAYE